ncbi:hypothetical protein FRB95_007867 [Tulasnella sp. JGI-2019a]|nr:hypothetical protein FRB95_007867 [Tulasnella sp. JGI-2019a]
MNPSMIPGNHPEPTPPGGAAGSSSALQTLQGSVQYESISIERPPLSFADLIKWAILHSPSQRATSEEICEAIRAEHPFYQDPEEFEFLKAGVRHRTSRKPQFVLLDEKPPGQTIKGNYWTYVAELDKPAARRGRSATLSDFSRSPPSRADPISQGTVNLAIHTPFDHQGVGSSSMSNPSSGYASGVEVAPESVTLETPPEAESHLGDPISRDQGMIGASHLRQEAADAVVWQYLDLDRLEQDRVASNPSGST